MDVQEAVRQLRRHATVVETFVRDAPPDQAAWKPDAESWSLLEVVGHLRDEEEFDFRVRLDIILHRPHEAWPPIDPPGWVTRHAYAERDLTDMLDSFLSERASSIAWLESLDDVDLSAASPAPWGGEIDAGDMLSAWVAHDLLHARQIVELRYAYVEQWARPHRVQYAGEW